MQKLINFRDLGSLITNDGRIVAPNRLFRSGEPVNLDQKTKQDLVEKYNVKTIVDLRGKLEIKESPIDLPQGCDYVGIDILENSGANDASRSAYMEQITAQVAQDYLKKIYRIFVQSDNARKGFRKFIDVLLAQSEGATLFHCFAGKDRTGVCAAIILTLLGVSKKDIFDEFLLTNILRREANENELAQMKTKGFSQEQIQGFEVALLVDKEYLECTYDEAKKTYGSFENFIKQGIGVTVAEIETLKQMYLINA